MSFILSCVDVKSMRLAYQSTSSTHATTAATMTYQRMSVPAFCTPEMRSLDLVSTSSTAFMAQLPTLVPVLMNSKVMSMPEGAEHSSTRRFCTLIVLLTTASALHACLT
nr:MAG: hypothetical protein [Molluscum contagiosum virus]